MKKANFILGVLICLLFSSAIVAQNKPLTIKVMSYNIHHGNPPGKGGLIDLDAIATTIANSGAEVIALQEVDVNTKRSNYVNQAQVLAQKLNMNVFFSKAIDFDGGEYGLAILSKFRMSDANVISLSKAADSTTENRILQWLSLDITDNISVLFANTHLEVANTGNRPLQARQIVEFVKQQQQSFILAGDWNAGLNSETLNILDTVFRQTCDVCPITYPEDGEAIDFIAFTKQSPFKTLNYTVFSDNKYSDHYPIMAEIKIH